MHTSARTSRSRSRWRARYEHRGGRMLRLSGVVAGYGFGDVLRGVDLAVDRGSVTCVVGPNGAGKSTVLRSVSGLLRPRKGAITFQGEDIGGLPPPQGLAAAELFPIVAERGDERAGNLSGGQRRTVEFARSLMLDPTLVMLDEPSVGLDPKALRVVAEAIRQMREAGERLLMGEPNGPVGLGSA